MATYEWKIFKYLLTLLGKIDDHTYASSMIQNLIKLVQYIQNEVPTHILSQFKEEQQTTKYTWTQITWEKREKTGGRKLY